MNRFGTHETKISAAETPESVGVPSGRHSEVRSFIF